MKNSMPNNVTPDKAPISAGQVRNANSQTIFGNANLTCQFLKNYSNLPIFSNITPEDIEDVTEHYKAYLGIDFDTDTVKKVRVNVEGEQREVFVLPLIEHKSYVDYDVAMQIFRYMAVIWYTYAGQQNALHENISHTKRFRYPLIIPIVYYEGARPWTADFHLKDRIENASEMGCYVPDFRYSLVNCRDYTKEELENKHDEMSLVMLINKIQNPGDYSDFFKTSRDYATRIYANAPDDIKKVFTDILWSLFMKMNVPAAEARDAIAQLEVSGMGYLFENAEKMDIQAERKNTEEQRERAEAAEKRADNAEQRADSAEQRADSAEQRADSAEQRADSAEQRANDSEHTLDLIIKDLIQRSKASGHTKEEVQKSLQSDYAMKESDAKNKVEKYWN